MMPRWLNILLLVLTASIVNACAATDAPTPGSPNQPHLPPPDFPAVSAPVGTTCGGMVRVEGPECGPNEYCHREIADQCGAADAPGVCRSMPEACPASIDPVCGCDGQTYSHECVANMDGVSAAYRGECK